MKFTTAPPELVRKVEDETYFATCDWGHCDRDMDGWAFDPEPNMGWLEVCREHLRQADSDGYAVVPFDQAASALTRKQGPTS